MKALIGTIGLILLMIVVMPKANAQRRPAQPGKAESLYNEAKTEFQGGDTRKAIELLDQALKNDPGYYMAHFALADIYDAEGDLDKEMAELKSGLSLAGNSYPNGFKFLAKTQFAKGQYDEALLNANQFAFLKKSLTPEEQNLIGSCRFAAEAVKNPVAFVPVNPGPSINSPSDEYWPSLDAEARELVFTRLIDRDRDGNKLPVAQEDFYVSVCDSGQWLAARAIGDPVNTPDNEGAQCISADGRLLFFTACGRPDGLGSCDIYMSVRGANGQWSDPVNLGSPVNSGGWESQPSVSADGRYLFFVSNRAGGKGKMDIWQAEKLGISEKGFPVYGKVVNVQSINSPGNELSPFIHADGKSFYFASDYWPGMGGTDLFISRIDNHEVEKPVNLGYPINTSGNEEGLVVEVLGKKAWYTAKNENSAGKDILYFDLPENIQPLKVSYVKGRVVDSKSKDLLSSDMVLQDLARNEEVQHIFEQENKGEFLFCLPSGKNYGLNVACKGYLFRSFNFDLQDVYSKSNPLYLTVELDRIEKEKSTILENIFFETDSWQLKPESAPQLAEMVSFLKSNPGLVVEIGGHTDHVGTAEYNLTLSEKRAQAVVDHLIKGGIAPERLKSRGYGFTRPIGDNNTDEGRKVNRRTELKIVQD